MGRRAKAERRNAVRHGRWPWLALVAAGVVLAAGGLWWAGRAPQDAGGGVPRLVVDRTEVDLGYRRYEEPARVSFTLTNAGDGLLRLAEVPRVKAVAGC